MRRKVLYVDAGIVDLVVALNQIKGTETISSCDGHGVQHAWVSVECSPEAADALFNLVIRKGNAYIRIIHNNRTSWYDVMPYSGEAICSDKSSGKILRKAMAFSEAVSIAYEIIKNAQNKVGMSIGFPREYNGEPVPVLKQRLLEDLAQNGLLEEECPFDIRPVPKNAWSFHEGHPPRKPVLVRGILEVKRDGKFKYGFLRDGNKHTLVSHGQIKGPSLKAGDMIEGDAWTFYDHLRLLGMCVNWILLDAEESGRSLDDYFCLRSIYTINGTSV